MIIQLPKPFTKGKKSVEECIYQRKSVRKYKNKEIELEKISQILWACQGKKGEKRTVPSAGATYPLEIYVNIRNKGLFHYEFKEHILELRNQKDLSEKIVLASWNQHFIIAQDIKLNLFYQIINYA